jgi:hypothetical protein
MHDTGHPSILKLCICFGGNSTSYAISLPESTLQFGVPLAWVVVMHDP